MLTQSGDKNPSKTIRQWFALRLGGFLFVSVVALSPVPAQAVCEWNVPSGEWGIVQSNGYHIMMNVRQNGTNVTGTARSSRTGYAGGIVEGRIVHGAIQVNNFYVEIAWNNSTSGIYQGTIEQTGRIRGWTYDKNNESSTTTFYTGPVMKCIDPPAAPTPPPGYKPIKRSGKLPPTSDTASAPTRAELPGPADYKKTADDVKTATVTPTLRGPKTVQIPAGENTATTNLIWNVGTGRSIIGLIQYGNGGEVINSTTLPTVAGSASITQPTGTIAVKVNPGTNVFSLRQHRQTLASVTVIGKGPTPAASASEGGEYSSDDTQNRHGKHKKNKKQHKHHHHDDDDD